MSNLTDVLNGEDRQTVKDIAKEAIAENTTHAKKNGDPDENFAAKKIEGGSGNNKFKIDGNNLELMSGTGASKRTFRINKYDSNGKTGLTIRDENGDIVGDEMILDEQGHWTIGGGDILSNGGTGNSTHELIDNNLKLNSGAGSDKHTFQINKYDSDNGKTGLTIRDHNGNMIGDELFVDEHGHWMVGSGSNWTRLGNNYIVLQGGGKDFAINLADDGSEVSFYPMVPDSDLDMVAGKSALTYKTATNKWTVGGKDILINDNKSFSTKSRESSDDYNSFILSGSHIYGDTSIGLEDTYWKFKQIPKGKYVMLSFFVSFSGFSHALPSGDNGNVYIKLDIADIFAKAGIEFHQVTSDAYSTAIGVFYKDAERDHPFEQVIFELKAGNPDGTLSLYLREGHARYHTESFARETAIALAVRGQILFDIEA